MKIVRIILAILVISFIGGLGCEKAGLKPTDEEIETTVEETVPPETGAVTDETDEVDDMDDDGIPDDEDEDTDGDGTPNAQDDDDDNDGFADAQDCFPLDNSAFPGARDMPDLEYKDSNCDGIDGDLANALWVSKVRGAVGNPGTFQEPMNSIVAAIHLLHLNDDNKQIFVMGGEDEVHEYESPLILQFCEVLFGGYGVGTDGRPVRNIEQFKTILKNTGDGSIVYVSNDEPHQSSKSCQDNGKAILQGFELSKGEGVAPIAVVSANATIEGNTITTDGTGAHYSFGVYIDHVTDVSKTVQIKNNVFVTKADNQDAPSDVIYTKGAKAVFYENEKPIRVQVSKNTFNVESSKNGAIAVQLIGKNVEAKVYGNIINVGMNELAGAGSSAGIALGGGNEELKIKESYVFGNRIFVKNGDEMLGIMIASQDMSYIYNNMITVGNNTNRLAVGVYNFHGGGYLASNNIRLNTENDVLDQPLSVNSITKRACGYLGINAKNDIYILDNIFDASPSTNTEADRWAVCVLKIPGTLYSVDAFAYNYFSANLTGLFYGLYDSSDWKELKVVSVEELNGSCDSCGENIAGPSNVFKASDVLEGNLDTDCSVFAGKGKGGFFRDAPYDLTDIFDDDYNGEKRGEVWDIGAIQCPR